MSVMITVGDGITIKKCTMQERDQRLRDLCKAAGVRLIRLRSTKDAPTEHFGAQPVVISSVKTARGGVKITADFRRQPNGEPNTRGLLAFTPNDFGVFEAEIPVSEKNMRLLAIASLRWTPMTADWEIVEQSDKDEVERFANDPVNRTKYDWGNVKKIQAIEARPYRETVQVPERTSIVSEESVPEVPVVLPRIGRPHLKATTDRMKESLV